MPYCRNCGAELRGNERFCPACGVSVAGVERREETRRPDGVRVVLIILGSLILLVSFGLFVGGWALFQMNTGLADREGFITTRTHQLQTDSYAIAFEHVNIEVGEVVGSWGIWRPSPRDLVTIKIAVSSNDPSKNVFMGIASASDAATYLNNVRYDEITRFSVSASRLIEIEYSAHPGSAVPNDPTTRAFWVISGHGPGTQVLEWQPEPGNYWIVLMNEDGSAGLDLTLELGVKIYILSTIASVLLIGGVVALIAGGIALFFGLRR